MGDKKKKKSRPTAQQQPKALGSSLRWWCPGGHSCVRSLSAASALRGCAGGSAAGRARRAAGRGRTPSPPPRSRWSCAWPGSRASTDPTAPTGPGTPARDGLRGGLSAGHGGAWGLSYLIGGHGHDPVQVLHQLLEGGALGGHGVPAVAHHHVPVWGGGSRAHPWVPGSALAMRSVWGSAPRGRTWGMAWGCCVRA